jgi:hypothetical protein
MSIAGALAALEFGMLSLSAIFFSWSRWRQTPHLKWSRNFSNWIAVPGKTFSPRLLLIAYCVTPNEKMLWISWCRVNRIETKTAARKTTKNGRPLDRTAARLYPIWKLKRVIYQNLKFLFSKSYRRTLGRAQPSIRLEQRSEVDHCPPFSAEFKNEWSYTSTPHVPFWRGQEQPYSLDTVSNSDCIAQRMQ